MAHTTTTQNTATNVQKKKLSTLHQNDSHPGIRSWLQEYVLPRYNMLVRLLRQWWQNNKMMWWAFWHIVRCGDTCEAYHTFVWTGGSYSSAAYRIRKGKCHPRLPK